MRTKKNRSIPNPFILTEEEQRYYSHELGSVGLLFFKTNVRKTAWLSFAEDDVNELVKEIGRTYVVKGK